MLVVILRRVHAHHHQPLIGIPPCPVVDMWQAALAVDAVPRPEVHQHYLTLQLRGIQRWGIEPLTGPGQRWHGPVTVAGRKMAGQPQAEERQGHTTHFQQHAVLSCHGNRS
ncbi:hypothetical protein D3C73_1425700 [compost metagenome]